MSDPIHTEEYKDYVIKIFSDDTPMNPRTDWDNFGKMVCWHRRYKLGDEQPKQDPQEYRDSIIPDEAVCLPLYLYDHSGITMSTAPFSCKWDSGQVGFIWASKEDVIQEFGDFSIESKRAAEDLLRSEVKTYDQFLTGQVYGYVCERDGEHISSCWGFFGDYDDEYMLQGARDECDCDERIRLPLLAAAGELK